MNNKHTLSLTCTKKDKIIVLYDDDDADTLDDDSYLLTLDDDVDTLDDEAYLLILDMMHTL